MDSDRPLVSCVMAAYNAASYIRESLKSLQEQSHENLEIIVVDDGSTDDTARIVEAEAITDKRIKLLRIENCKQAVARNLGMEHSQSEFIVNLDADDLSVPNRIERQLAFLRDNVDVVAVGGAIRLIDGDGFEIGVENPPTSHVAIRENLLKGNAAGGIILSASMFRKSSVQLVGGFRTAFVPAEDYDLWLRLSEFGRLANLVDVVTEYRVHLSSDSSTQSRTQLIMATKARAEAYERNNLPAPRFGFGSLFTVQPLDRVLAVYARFGKHKEAIKLLANACRTGPFRAANFISLLRWFWICCYASKTRTS